MSAKLFEAALGITDPWFINGVEFDAGKKELTIAVDFVAGSRFAVPGVEGLHPVHDTVTKRYRHLNFFQHECQLEVRVPRVKLPDGGVRQVEPGWAGKLAGFTLLAVRGADPDAVPRDDLHRCRPFGESLLASGDGYLQALRRSEPGAGRLLRSEAPGGRRNLEGART